MRSCFSTALCQRFVIDLSLSDMFKVKKPDKRGRVRLETLRTAFMTVQDGEPQGDDVARTVAVEQEDHEEVANVAQAVEGSACGEELGAADDWREGDADFYDVEHAAYGEGDPQETVQEQETDTPRSRWPPATDANDVAVFMAGLQAKREVPIAVFQDLMHYFNENRDVVARALRAGELQNFRTLRDRAARSVPFVRMDAVFKDTNGSTVSYQGLRAYPQKEVANRKLKRQYVLYYVSLTAVINFHMELHPEDPVPAFFDLSVDGIPESKSGGRSVDVLSIRFAGCRTIYSIAILQPDRRGMSLSDDLTLTHFLREYPAAGIPLRYVIADAPKRAALSGLKQHSSNQACQYCKAQKVERAFPWNTCAAPPRSDAETRAIAEAGAGDDGVKKPSPLRSIATLDIIRHIPAEHMHLCDLGIVRKMVQLSFKCPQFKAQQVPFQRADDAELNKALEAAASLPQFSRRTRPLDTANYKAEEYRNLAIVYWPAVAMTVPAVARNVWLMTVFAYRACLLNDESYAKWQAKYDEAELFRQWYVNFDDVYGTQNCSYNPHTFHHLPLVRKLAPLTDTAAYAFENHYNFFKRSYRAGTASMGQQALTALLVSARHGHTCAKRRSITGKVSRKVDDSWCYVSDVGVIKVSKVMGSQFLGRRIATDNENRLLPDLDFNDVLAFKISEPTTYGLPTTYEMAEVVGKCVVVDGFASVVEWDVLEE